MLNELSRYYGMVVYRITQHGNYADLTPLDDRSYLVNSGVVVYLKHATEPNSNGRYQFTFGLREIDRFLAWNKEFGPVVLSLICAEANEVCCLPFDAFWRIWEDRQHTAGDIENQFTLNVTLPAGRGFRVFANYPRRRGQPLGRPLIVPRSDFPDRIFELAPARLAPAPADPDEASGVDWRSPVARPGV